MLRTVCLVLVAVAASQGAPGGGVPDADSSEVQEDGPLVVTAQGSVRGTRHAESGYSSFTGMRYAQAPNGRNRFRNALPLEPWNDIFVANQNDISCQQIQVENFIGINDCLTLNVYTPDVANPDNPVAVMVYFHGGGFTMGSVTLHSHDFLIKHDVVVVLANFRISALGHLCLRHELIPGNAAFKDQVAALHWVQQNIRAFGGDPDNVTIMGHSGGGISVELLSLSPLAEGLFDRVIGVSGSALAFWAVNPDPIRHATTMAQTFLGYDGDSIEDLVEFFLATDDEALARATENYQFYREFIPITPCVEEKLPGVEAFLTDTPANIIESGQYTPVPKIYAVAPKEYVNMITPDEIENVGDLMQNLETQLPTDLVFQSDQQRTEIANRVREFYISDEKSILESYIDYRSDTLFYHSISRAARVRPSTSETPIYMLEFLYESERRFPRWPEVDAITAAGHGDDLLYLVMSTTLGLPISPEDQVIIDKYTKLFTNFAKYNNPTPEANELQWPRLTATQFPCFQMDSEVRIAENPNAAALELWDQIYAELDKPHVQIAQGLLSGTHHPEAGYSSFTGIPYGTIPSGQDRFKSPLPPPSWTGTFVADQDSIWCPQVWGPGLVGTEDCLIVNVYTPDTTSETNPLSVIVYVHGGGFVGSSSAYFGPDQLLPHGVVVVTVNYRVGPLGHLCLGHELVPGNAAFKDQVAALRWVRDNIAAFGGDPNSVTIMGQSSGGVSVDLLTLSPMTEGLFRGAISLSGAARAYWAIVPDPVAVATTMAEMYMDYNGNSFEELVEFYLAADIETLSIATDRLLQEFGIASMPFAGCVEKEFPDTEAFLADTPANILASGEFISVPTIYTVTNRECVNMITDQQIENITEIVAHLGDYLPHDLITETADQRTEIVNRLTEFYINEEVSALEGFIDFMSDAMFYHGLARSARERQATTSSPIYVMEFAFESAMRVPRLPAVDGIMGAGHGDDVLFVIARVGADVTLSPEDQRITYLYGLLFSNFAKHGEPTPQNEPIAWLPVTEEQLWYLELGSELSVSLSPNAAAIALWDEIYAGWEPEPTEPPAPGTSARILPSLCALILTALLLGFNLR